MSRPQDYEVRPDAQGVTGVSTQPKNVSNIDYEPYPEQSIKLDHTRQHIVDSICRLYSGSASEDDMQVYASESIYDDPWSYCDTRYKIAGQWWGIPKLFAKSQTIKTQVVQDDKETIIFKLQQEYTPKVIQTGKKVNSLITLTLDADGKVKYHKDMWNEKDYSHAGLGKVFKTLNGDHLTKITQPPSEL